MKVFIDYLDSIDIREHRDRMESLLSWISEEYPMLTPEIKWNQPMFTYNGTFIIGLSVSKKHIAVAPEEVTITKLEEEIIKSNYDYTKGMIRILWADEIDYPLIGKMIEFNLEDKKDCRTFWRS